MKFTLYLLIMIGVLVNTSNAQTYVFATFPFKPWGFSHNNEASGIIPEIAHAIAEKAGISITIKLVPYARMVKGIKHGKIDFAILSRNIENDQFVNYIKPVFIQNVILLTRKGQQITSLESLYEQDKIHTIGQLRGSNLFPELDKDKKITMYQVKSFAQGLKMLKAKRIDAFLTIDKTSWYESNKLGLTEAFAFPGYPLTKIEGWIQVSKKSHNEESFPYEAISTAVKVLTDNGVIEEIIQKHIENPDILKQQNR